MDDIKDIQNLETVGEGKQYIVVRLGSEQYGIDIKYVDNIDYPYSKRTGLF